MSSKALCATIWYKGCTIRVLVWVNLVEMQSFWADMVPSWSAVKLFTASRYAHTGAGISAQHFNIKDQHQNELYSGWTEFCPACSPKMINKVKLLFYSPTTMVNTSHAPAKETNRRVITSWLCFHQTKLAIRESQRPSLDCRTPVDTILIRTRGVCWCVHF